MRLDLFLKASRIVPRRPLSKRLCDEGKVLLNGKAARAAHEVHPGDAIQVDFPGACGIWRILAVPSGKNVSREQARELTVLVETWRKDEFS